VQGAGCRGATGCKVTAGHEPCRHIDDASGSEQTLSIPRHKLEEVLRDAQNRIDEAEARCEQLTVQLLLYQERPASGDVVDSERVGAGAPEEAAARPREVDRESAAQSLQMRQVRNAA